MKKYFQFLSNSITSIRNSADISPLQTHINEAMDWLKRAQDVNSDGGISSGFHLYHGFKDKFQFLYATKA